MTLANTYEDLQKWEAKRKSVWNTNVGDWILGIILNVAWIIPVVILGR